MNKEEEAAELVWVVIITKCPECRYGVKRFVCLTPAEAEAIERVFRDEFVQGVEVRVLRSGEVVDYIQLEGGDKGGRE